MQDVSRWTYVCLQRTAETTLLPECLAPEEQESFYKIQPADRKQQFLGTRQLIKKAFGNEASVMKDTQGKPYVRATLQPIQPVCITHTKEWVAIGWGPVLGIDIEHEARLQKNPINDRIPIPWKHLGNDTASLCRIWTMAEALIKTGYLSWADIAQVYPGITLNDGIIWTQRASFKSFNFSLQSKRLPGDAWVTAATMIPSTR